VNWVLDAGLGWAFHVPAKQAVACNIFLTRHVDHASAVREAQSAKSRVVSGYAEKGSEGRLVLEPGAAIGGWLPAALEAFLGLWFRNAAHDGSPSARGRRRASYQPSSPSSSSPAPWSR